MKLILGILVVSVLASPVYAQKIGAGAEVLISGRADLKVTNDQAVVSFFIEEVDKDKTLAATRVNQKMKAGIEFIKREYKEIELSTRNYHSSQVYEEVASKNANSMPTVKQQANGWRVGQYLDLKTRDLKNLPGMVAYLQKTLALNNVRFELSDEVNKRVEAERIVAGYKNLNERIAMIAQAMGRQVSDFIIDSIDFEGGEIDRSPNRAYGRMVTASASNVRGDKIVEPDFEPGMSAISIRVDAKLRVK
jgi:predicted secreted protein